MVPLPPEPDVFSAPVHLLQCETSSPEVAWVLQAVLRTVRRGCLCEYHLVVAPMASVAPATGWRELPAVEPPIQPDDPTWLAIEVMGRDVDPDGGETWFPALLWDAASGRLYASHAELGPRPPDPEPPRLWQQLTQLRPELLDHVRLRVIQRAQDLGRTERVARVVGALSDAALTREAVAARLGARSRADRVASD